MLLAQTATAADVFFPPWYFWLFVLATVIVVLSAVLAIVYLNLSAETERRRHDRETAARLIEIMVVQRKMSPDEVEQILNSYWQLGNFWHRFRRWFVALGKGPDTKLPTKAESY